MNLIYATFGANKIEGTGTFEYLDQYSHSEQKLIAYFCDATKIRNNNFCPAGKGTIYWFD